MAFIFENSAFQEIFLMLGTILTFTIAFVIYFSFTTVGKYGNIFLSLIQPILAIVLYSIFSVQFNIIFFSRAIIFFSICATIFVVPYGRGLSQVSKIYKEATGLGGYEFIRAFTLSIITNKNDARIEKLFDRVGINSDIRIQYVLIRSIKNKNLKGLFVVPHVHFGPFKTCGSSDLPEHIYKAFKDIPGITVYHTTNDHTQNLTTQGNVEIILERIKKDINAIRNDGEIDLIAQFFGKVYRNGLLITTIESPETKVEKFDYVILDAPPVPVFSPHHRRRIPGPLVFLAAGDGYPSYHCPRSFENPVLQMP